MSGGRVTPPSRASSALVAVAGWPGTGKTTLARALGARLGLPVFTKDDIKERLFDTIGTGDRAWSKGLGVAAFAILNRIAQEVLERRGSLILEANFDAAFAGPQLRPIIDKAGAASLVVVVTGAPDVVDARFRARAGSPARHPGHLDAEMFEEISAVVATEYQPPVLGGAQITVDLTDLSRFDAALDAVAQALEVAAPHAAQHRSGE